MGMAVQNPVSWTQTYKGHSMRPKMKGVAPLGLNTDCPTAIASFQSFTVQSEKLIGCMDYQ